MEFIAENAIAISGFFALVMIGIALDRAYYLVFGESPDDDE